MRPPSCLLAVGAVMAVAALTAVPAVPALGAPKLPHAPACPSCGHNLILNPGAEAGRGADSDSIVKVPDWKQTGGFTAAQYAWGGGDVSATSPGPKNRGKNYFYGGPDAARSTGTQMIAIKPAGVSSGKVLYAVSAWLGGYDSQGDDAALYVTFENSSGAALGSVSLGPVTEAQRDSNSEMLYRHKTGGVPAATTEVKVELVIVRYSGSDNDGLADNLSLSFSMPAAKAH